MRFVLCVLVFSLLGCATGKLPDPVIPTPMLSDAEGNPLWWEQFPLQICVGEHAMHSIGVQLDLAVRWWQEKTERFIFRGDKLGECDVYVYSDPEMISRYVEEGNAGSTLPIYDPESLQIKQSYVFIRPDLQADVLARTIAHELGHAIGLAHSESPWSVMYRFATAAPWEIEEADILAVQQLVDARK